MGAQGGTLTFMVGGTEAAFAKGRPILANMGRTIVHAGPSGNGQIAKICNNMMLAVSMIGVCEGFALAEKLGLPAQTLWDICSTSTSQCWAMTNYCPMPGPVPAAPSNRGYPAGFTAANMLKDLRLSQAAAGQAAAATPMGAAAANLYQLFVDGGKGALDFSAVMQLVRRGGHSG
jgi:3-hydroxyisobutyrate dehydrogenase